MVLGREGKRCLASLGREQFNVETLPSTRGIDFKQGQKDTMLPEGQESCDLLPRIMKSIMPYTHNFSVIGLSIRMDIPVT
jgi:hypothetical protein